MKKTVLILANSMKDQHRCIAGREVLLVAGGGYRLGSWVRPVSDHDEGAIGVDEYTLSNGRAAGLFDFVEIDLRLCCFDRFQPENWFIVKGSRWVSVNEQYGRYPVAKLQERPNGLWLCDGEKTDRIGHRQLMAVRPSQSLYVIRPHDFHIELSRQGSRLKKRAVFDYGGQRYRLSLTDPSLRRSYCLPFPEKGEKPVIIHRPEFERCLICVSLTGNFFGNHYKVVAAIYENV